MYNQFTSIRPAVIDEISLEGLDGITLEALWTRLSDRLVIPLPLPKHLCQEIWNIVVTSDEIDIFELPVAREPFVLFDRYEHVDPLLGMVVEPKVLPPVIYTYCPIEDKVNNIRGSCSTYKTRVNITMEAKELPLDEALENWGLKLVLVASQKARNEALFEQDLCPGVELTKIQYCILERIGRSRYQGEVTQGRISLQDMKIDAKSLFYHRKSLMRYKLITKQIHHQKSGSHNTAGTLLHLPRFFVERKPKACYLTAEVVEILREKPNYMAEYDEIKRKLGMENSLKKLFKTAEFQKFVKTDLVMPYRTLYPDAKVKEWKHKGSDKERSIRILQLNDPNIDVLELWGKDSEDQETANNEEPESLGMLDYSRLKLDRSMVSQAYRIVEAAGPNGLSQTEIGRIMGQSKLCSRMICRRLQGMKVVFTLLEDVGRQRVTRFVSCKFDNSHMALKFKKERKKLLDYLSTTKPFVPAVSANENDVEMLDEAIEDKSSINLLTEELLLLSNENSNDSEPHSEPVGDCKEDEVDVKFIETKVDKNIKGYSVGVLDSFNVTVPADYTKKDTSGITYRLLKRANFIIENVRINQVITDLTKLMRLIHEEENREGYFVKIDKRSLLRMLMKLSRDGYLKIIQARLETKSKSKSKTLTFICECDVTTEHSVILSELEQAKMKMFITSQIKLVKAPPTPAPDQNQTPDINKFTSETITQSMKELKQIANKNVKSTFIYDAKLSKKYGYQPKLVRMKVIHHLLYHTIYTNIGEPLSQSEAFDFLKTQGFEITPELGSQLSPIYFKEVSWRMFIPPLPVHMGWPRGWTIMCDILLRLPLSIFLQVCNISYVVPNLDEYLEHPIKRHILVKHLPLEVRNDLTVARKYIFAIHEVIQRLCYIGLVQFGPQRLKEKDQVFVYLNKKAMLYDTRTSEPGYHQTTELDFPCIRHEFRSVDDIEKYWCEFWDISIHTNLGIRNSVYGQEIVLERAVYKSALQEAIKPREPEDAIKLDVGYIPGDKRGAAGVDSAMFTHLKRNWHWTNINQHQQQPYKKDDAPLVRDSKMNCVERSKILFKEFPCNKKITAATLLKGNGAATKKKHTTKKHNITLIKKSVPAMKNIVRNIKPRRTRRRPAYDEIDKQALLKMSKLRVDWHPNEDRLLLLCKVGLMYLFPDWRKITVGLHVIRDILHRVTNSYNKTSKACQRRILYIMKNPKTSNSVRLCLDEIRLSPEIDRNFGIAYLKKFRDEAVDHADYANMVTIHYIELIAVLRKTFSRLGVNLCPFSGIWPSNIENFKKRYAIRTSVADEKEDEFREPENITDIQRNVIRTVIHSSLCSVKDKTRWNYHLYNIYKQYPDQLLRSILSKLRALHMVSVKKNMARSIIRTGNLPLSSAPFQLSITYENQMRSKYILATFYESSVILRKLIDNFNTKSSEGVYISTTDGGTATGLSELTINLVNRYEICIPEQVVILDPRIREDDPTYERILQRYQDILRSSGAQNIPGHLDSESESEEEEPEKVCQPTTSQLTSQSSKYHQALSQKIGTQLTKRPADAILTPQGRVALSMEGIDKDPEAKQHLHDYFVVNSSNLYISFIDNNGKIPLSAELLHNDKKYSEKIMCAIKESADVKDMSKNEEEKRLVKTFRYQNECLEAIIMIARDLIDFVKSRTVLGATNADLIKRFEMPVLRETTLTLSELLNRLQEHQLVLQVGVCEPRYIHRSHAGPWLVHTTRLLRLEREKLPLLIPLHPNKRKRISEDSAESETCSKPKKQRLENENESRETEYSERMKLAKETSESCIQDHSNIPSLTKESEEIREAGECVESVSEPLNIHITPWIRVDGTVNRRVLDQWLSTVLSFCLSMPGVTLKTVQDKYIFQLPFHTRKLVEILVQLKCVQLLKLARSGTNLLSKKSQSSLGPATGLEKASDIIIMPLENAVLKFGVFVGERAHATSFLTHVK